MRIASLLPSATELLFAVGAGDEVVGVTHECDHPAAARRRAVLTRDLLPTAGASSADIDRHIRGALHAGSAIYALDEATLAGLRPDLIVTQELCEVCAVAYRDVCAAARRLPGEVPVISLEPSGLEDILATALALGDATGHADGARSLVAAMRAGIAAAEALPAPDPAPRVACIEWTAPLMAAGHWVPEMVRRAGGDDVLGAEAKPSEEISWDRLRDAGPEVMVLMPCGFDLAETRRRAAEMVGNPGFAGLPCAATGRVVAVDGSAYFNRPGPRIVHGLEILAAAVRARPGEPLPEGAAWVEG
jgi:iron complex transport system substrate-binding protein